MRRLALIWPSPEQRQAEFQAAVLLLKLQDGSPAPAGTLLQANHAFTIPGTTEQITFTFRFFIDGEGNVYAKGQAGLMSEGAFGITTLAENKEGERFVVKEIKSIAYKKERTLEKIELKRRLCHQQMVENELSFGKKAGVVKTFFKDEAQTAFDANGNSVSAASGIFILKYLGQDLFKYLFEQSPNNVNRVDRMDLAIKIARCVYELHELGIAHQDIKLKNITIDDNGQVHLIDFGHATPLVECVSDNRGTPFMLSPRIEHRSVENLDIFALLRTLFLPNRIRLKIGLQELDYDFDDMEQRPSSLFCEADAAELKQHFGNSDGFVAARPPFSPVNHYDDSLPEGAIYPEALQVYVTLLLARHGIFGFVDAYQLDRKKLLLILDIVTSNDNLDIMKDEIEKLGRDNFSDGWSNVFDYLNRNVSTHHPKRIALLASKLLFEAIAQDNATPVSELLSFDPDLTMLNRDNETPNVYAMRLKNMSIVDVFSKVSVSLGANSSSAAGGGASAGGVAPEGNEASSTERFGATDYSTGTLENNFLSLQSSSHQFVASMITSQQRGGGGAAAVPQQSAVIANTINPAGLFGAAHTIASDRVASSSTAGRDATACDRPMSPLGSGGQQ